MSLLPESKFTHFLYVPFTGLGLHNGYRGDQWLKNRIKLFKQFVLPSLLNQTNKNFILWISWREEDLNNQIIDEFGKSLSDIRDLKFLFTYGGICFWDDKYPDGVAAQRLQHNLSQTLPELKDITGDSEYVLMTIQPSDDMYLPEAVDTIQTFDFINHVGPNDNEVKVFGWLKGYIIDYATKQIAEYNPTTIPPFYTIRFPKDIFLDYNKHIEYIGPYHSHEEIGKLSRVMTQDRMFCVGIHGENTSTVFNHPYKGRMLSDKEQEAVLISLGIWFTDPLQIRKTGLRLWSRRILNLLPFNEQLRNYYHKLPIKPL